MVAVEVPMLIDEARDESLGASLRLEVAGRCHELGELRQQVLVRAHLRDGWCGSSERK